MLRGLEAELELPETVSRRKFLSLSSLVIATLSLPFLSGCRREGAEQAELEEDEYAYVEFDSEPINFPLAIGNTWTYNVHAKEIILIPAESADPKKEYKKDVEKARDRGLKVVKEKHPDGVDGYVYYALWDGEANIKVKDKTKERKRITYTLHFDRPEFTGLFPDNWLRKDIYIELHGFTEMGDREIALVKKGETIYFIRSLDAIMLGIPKEEVGELGAFDLGVSSEDVTTPLGEFKTQKIFGHLWARGTSASPEIVQTYFANDVGIVKIVETLGNMWQHTYELTKFERK